MGDPVGGSSTFRDLSRHGFGKLVHNPDVLRNLEVSDLPPAILPEVLPRSALAPGRGTTQAAMTSPYLASGSPTTATSAIAG